MSEEYFPIVINNKAYMFEFTATELEEFDENKPHLNLLPGNGFCSLLIIDDKIKLQTHIVLLPHQEEE